MIVDNDEKNYAAIIKDKRPIENALIIDQYVYDTNKENIKEDMTRDEI